LGCGRSLREIERWASFDADERARIMTELPERLTKLRHARARSIGSS
jgi:predicted Fe-S protein YdhL (DUF1289 family)